MNCPILHETTDYSQLDSMFDWLKTKSKFNPEEYIENKTRRINEFCRIQNIDSFVLGLSGGIDSAVVLSLLHEASLKKDSPIKKIVAISMPIYIGTSRQDKAFDLSWSHYNNITKSYFDIYHKPSDVLMFITSDLTIAANEYIRQGLDASLKNPWAIGQLASILRTPALYYHAAILQTKGLNSVVIGTTNKSEGSYIGFYGKASDGMVDVQPIDDIYKHQVYEVAKLLGVSEDIINAVPSGDVWNGAVDTEMIGVTYDILDSFLLMNECLTKNEIDSLINELTPENKNKFETSCQRIMELHRKNKHKYEVGKPSHSLNIFDHNLTDFYKTINTNFQYLFNV